MWNEKEFGRDDGIECSDCGGDTYVIDDDGNGEVSYQCANDSDHAFSVHYDSVSDEGDWWDMVDEYAYNYSNLKDGNVFN